MLGAGLGLLSGILSAFWLPEVPAWKWIAFLTSIWLILLWRRFWCLSWAVLGLMWVWGYLHLCFIPLAARWEGQDMIVTGRIQDIPVRRPWGWRFDLALEGRTDLPAKVRLSWYGGPKLKAGERWQLKVRLKRGHGFTNPGGFDYERYLFSQRIGAGGYVRRSQVNQKLAESSGLAAWRQQIADFFDHTLAQSPYRGIAKALAIGAQEGIAKNQWEVLQRTGTAHLISISGLHISLVAGLLYGFGRWLWLRFGHWRLAADQAGAIMALPGAVLYAALAGFSVPTQRALVMLGVGLVALLWRRPVRIWHVFGTALVAVLLVDPLAPLTVGFWLSFVAVFWILYALCNRLRPPRWSLLRVQGYLLIGLAPFLLIFFHQVSLSAPLANLVAVPLVNFGVVPWVLLSAGLVPLAPKLAAWLLEVPSLVLDWFWPALVWLADLDDGTWPLPSPPPWSVPLALLGIGWLLAPRGLPGRWLGAALLLPALAVETVRPGEGEALVTLLDVGQGLAVVVQTQNHALVYDTGPIFSDRFDAGGDVLVPFLKQSGHKRLDLIVVSHGDLDHAGGLAGLIQGFPAPILTSAVEKFPQLKATFCQAGQHWEWDKVKFFVLWPEEKTQFGTGKDNDRSCVLKIETAGGAVLLPGDLEQAAEASLVKRYGEALKALVLIAPHHGSATSSSWPLLKAVAPKYVLISSGYRNRFGFPSPKVLERYLKLDAHVLNTARDGAIEIWIGPRVQVKKWRERHSWLWSVRS